MSKSSVPMSAINQLPATIRVAAKQAWSDWWKSADKSSRSILLHDAQKPLWLRPMACSKWFAQICTNHPEWLEKIVLEVDAPRTIQDYRKRWQSNADDLVGLSQPDNEAQLMRSLRIFRHYEIARIIYRDSNRLGDTRSICLEISALAECLLNITIEWCYQKLCKQLGTPVDAQNHAQQLGVIGMGKIGGAELNLCSDIDVIFVFPSSGKTQASVQSSALALSNQQFFERQARSVIHAMSSQTEDGIVWKIDARLRPYGDDGPLVNSHNAMERYYETQGRDWERFAMCRARAIACDTAQTDALIKQLHPFVFRRYLDFSALNALHEMRQLIKDTLTAKDSENNIKLGWGGIRDAEFCVQFFQIVYGGKHTSLTRPSFYKTLDALFQLKLLNSDQTKQLTSSYSYLRNVEHALQAYNNRQTHELPGDPLEQNLVAGLMNCANWNAFITQLNRHRKAIENLARAITGEIQTEASMVPASLRALWQDPSSASSKDYLAKLAPEISKALCEELASFRSMRLISHLNADARAHLDIVLPYLLLYLVRPKMHPNTIKRCFDLMAAILRRVNYLALLANHPKVLERLVDLCACSLWAAQQLTNQPMLLDELLDIRTLHQKPNAHAMQKLLDQQITAWRARPNLNHSEQFMQAIKHFHTTQLFRIAVQDLDHLLSIKELTQQLSDVAETTLNATLAHCLSETDKPAQNLSSNFCIIAYGKLGSAEMSYSSDLDLVFLYDSQNTGNDHATQQQHKSANLSMFYTRLSQRVLTYINSSRIYKIDTRLRPSGQSGVLVSSYDAFERYQINKAWTWEHQALIASRALSGDQALCKKFEDLRRKLLCVQRNADTTRSEVIDMRAKMDTEIKLGKEDVRHYLKHAPGGMIDIGFIIQCLVLSHAYHHPELTKSRSIHSLLIMLNRLQLISASACEAMQAAHSAFSTSANLYTLNAEQALSSSRMQRYQNDVRKVWKDIMGTARPKTIKAL